MFLHCFVFDKVGGHTCLHPLRCRYSLRNYGVLAGRLCLYVGHFQMSARVYHVYVVCGSADLFIVSAPSSYFDGGNVSCCRAGHLSRWFLSGFCLL